MKPSDIKAAVIQCAPGAKKADNIALVAPLIEAAAASGAQVISLPEMWTCLGADRATKHAESEELPSPGNNPLPGSAALFLRDTARRLGVILHGGSIGERQGDTLFNTTLVFGPDGAELARYRKIHLFDVTTPSGQGYRESSLFGAGESIVTCEAGGVTLGLTICYDLRFAELFVALRQRGAGIILVPSAFTVETGRDHWEVLLRARAIETQCFVIAAATTGTHHDATGRPRQTYGHSLIIDPWGSVLACAPEGEGHAGATLDLTQLARVRDAMPVLAHRAARGAALASGPFA